MWPLNMFSSVGGSGDADFGSGERYVVGAGRSFDTHACTVTASDTSTRQRHAREPVTDGSTGADPPIGPLGQTVWLAGVLGAAAAAVALVRRHRHSDRGTPGSP